MSAPQSTSAPVSGQMQRQNIWLRGFLIATATVVVLGGVQLYILTEHTDKYFAWTIKLPLSAAVLGAFYFTGAPLLYIAAAQKWWPRMRALMPGMFVFVSLILTMTLIHLDQFHLSIDSAPSSAKGSAWIWLILYIIEPPGLALLEQEGLQVTEVGLLELAGQRRLPACFELGVDRRRTHRAQWYQRRRHHGAGLARGAAWAIAPTQPFRERR